MKYLDVLGTIQIITTSQRPVISPLFDLPYSGAPASFASVWNLSLIQLAVKYIRGGLVIIFMSRRLCGCINTKPQETPLTFAPFLRRGNSCRTRVPQALLTFTLGSLRPFIRSEFMRLILHPPSPPGCCLIGGKGILVCRIILCRDAVARSCDRGSLPKLPFLTDLVVRISWAVASERFSSERKSARAPCLDRRLGATIGLI
ncbi:hypothetical protein FPV67DRAFT_99579 [Lyophyllum atratum]|nr:hypothetical protein FPV67DRAFT_99579 [Lyophyllum atratum]